MRTAPAAATSNADDNAVAIVGQGCIFPGAHTVAAFWDLLMTGRDPKCLAPPNRWSAELFCDPSEARPYHATNSLGGYITDYQFDWRKHKVPPKQVAQANPLQFMLLDATYEALRDAGYDKKPYDRTRVSVVVGTEFGGDFGNRLQMGLRLPEFKRTLKQVAQDHGVGDEQIAAITAQFTALLLERMPAILDETGSFTSSTLASRITKAFDFMGGALALDAGMSSAVSALSAAADILLTDSEATMVVCAAGQRSMELLSYQGLSLAGLLASGEPRAGFDSDADGLVPGEGVGVVLLKRLADAKRDGDPIRGIIRGIGQACVTNGSFEDALQIALKRCLEHAAVAPEQIVFVEATGMGSPDTDKIEAEQTAAAYGASTRCRPLLIGNLIAQIGHTGAASGMAALIKNTLSMEHAKVPASFGFKTPLPAFQELADVLQPVPTPVPLVVSTEDGRCFTGLTTFDDTMVSHLILERGTPLPSAPVAASTAITAKLVASVPPKAAPAELPRLRFLVRVGAANLAELEAACRRLQQSKAEDFASLQQRRFRSTDTARLVFMAQDCRQLSELAKGFSSTNSSRDPNVFFCGRVGQRPRIAFLFPGQGSQYKGMLRKLVRESTVAAEIYRQIDATMAAIGCPSFAQLAWDSDEELNSDPCATQLSMLLADHLMDRVLAANDIRPDVVSGHSYGEYPALVAAGCWTLEQAARVTRIRAGAVKGLSAEAGAMLSIKASAADVARELGRRNGSVAIANENAPDQTIVGGLTQDIDALAAHLKQSGFPVRRLTVPGAFHTPLMRGVQQPLEFTLKDEVICRPRCLFLSSVTNRYTIDPQQIKQNLVEQMTQPVRYVNLVQRLAREEAEILIEVGPSQVLTRLNAKILHDSPTVLLSSDDAARPGTDSLLRLQATLESMGALDRDNENAPRPQKSAPVIHFDGTAVRRSKMRKTAEKETRPTLKETSQKTGFGGYAAAPATLVPSPVGAQPAPLLARSLSATAVAAPTVAAPARAAIKASVPAAAVRSPRQESSSSPSKTPGLSKRVVLLTGSVQEAVARQAEFMGDEIRRLIRRLVDLSADWIESEELAAVVRRPERLFNPNELNELTLLAAKLDLPLGALVTYQLATGAGSVEIGAHLAVAAHDNSSSGLLHVVGERSYGAFATDRQWQARWQLRSGQAGNSYLMWSLPGQIASPHGTNGAGVMVSCIAASAGTRGSSPLRIDL